MWYEGKGVISIGCQNGGPKDNGVCKIKVDLWHHLCDCCKSTFCDDIDHFAIALRVGGEFSDYDKEQIWKIRRRKKDRFIGGDIDIPMSVWSTKTTNELKFYISEKLVEAIILLVARLKKDKVMVDDEHLLKDINEAIARFNKNEYQSMA